ncbi:MAG TPA: hypothetical protein VGI33_10060 [Paenibacillus sp.]|jgi:hypothetical protein
MPNIVDSTVIAAAYDTSGNGGRKLVRLANGWLVSCIRTTTEYVLRRSIDNGLTWTQHTQSGVTGLVDTAIVAVGNVVYFMMTYANGSSVNWRHYNIANGTSSYSGFIEQGQTALGNCSLAVNEAGTELHAAWSSKNATNPNSFNIRYAKGVINASTGAVTWGAAEPITTFDTASINLKNPTIAFLSSGYPLIIAERLVSVSGNDGITSYTYNGSTWTDSNYPLTAGGYAQTSISSTFVPKSINGLANGLVGMAWHGTDTAHTTTNYIRFSKLINSGVTWSTMQKLVPGTNATLTANKNGKLFITYEDVGVTKRIESTNNGDTWGAAITVGAGTNPSSLVDLTLDMSAPLTIRKGASGVLFSGSWTAVSNSIPPGFIGTKDNKSNLLTYTITTDGNMSTITEKVNGVVIGTKTATSGQNLTVGLTQAQWDAVKFGKYKDSSVGVNMITVEMGGNIWAYTFDKRLAADSDVLSAVKATQDVQTTFLPAVKSKISEAIRGKDVAALNTDTWTTIAAKIGQIQMGKGYVEGNMVPFTGDTIYVANLPFTPTFVVLKYRADGYSFGQIFILSTSKYGDNSASGVGYGPNNASKTELTSGKIDGRSFSKYLGNQNGGYNLSNIYWIAIE